MSTQHYFFAVEAFVDLLQEHGGPEYDFCIRETKTYEIIEDVAPYPRLSYEQGEHNAFYFSEEILSTLECAKEIMVSDRATLFNLLIGLDGYTICSGVINSTLNGPNIVAVPLDVDDHMEIGYLLHKRTVPSRFALSYIEALRRHTVGD